MPRQPSVSMAGAFFAPNHSFEEKQDQSRISAVSLRSYRAPQRHTDSPPNTIQGWKPRPRGFKLTNDHDAARPKLESNHLSSCYQARHRIRFKLQNSRNPARCEPWFWGTVRVGFGVQLGNSHQFRQVAIDYANLRAINNLAYRSITVCFPYLSIVYAFPGKFVISRSPVQLRSSAPTTRSNSPF
jgi:hypothetical protein